MQLRHFATFTLILCLFGGTSAQNEYASYPIGFYNLENLFDTLDQEDVRDTEFSPKGQNAWTYDKYLKKLTNMASVIEQLGTDQNPDGIVILGVSEIENRGVLEDLVKEPAIKMRNYQIVHYDSPDKRGVDVGLLYNPTYFQVTDSKSYELMLEDNGVRKFTRDVLLVKGELANETIYVLVNHWPSRSGGEKKSAPYRAAAAKLNKHITDSLFQENKQSKILIMGDLNDDPTSPSVKKVLNAKAKIEQVKEGGFYNPMYAKYQRGEGSNAYRDAWSLFDQIILSKPLLDKTQDGLFFYKAIIYKEPRLLQPSGQYKGYPYRTFGNGLFMNGYSDHFPAVAYLLKKAS